MEKTTNYKLYKPSYDDDVDIQILNNNMDILDDNLKRNNDKISQYLPLSGGTMQGDIKLPYGAWQGLRSVRNDEEYLTFNETSFNGVKLPTLCTKSDRFKFYYDGDTAFTVDNTGAWLGNEKVVTDLWTENGWHSGYTKLSTKTLIQWGYANPTDVAGNIQHVTFQTPFTNPQYAVVVSKSNGTSGKPTGGTAGDWWSATYNFTTTGFDMICDQKSYGHTYFWIAIGRGVN